MFGKAARKSWERRSITLLPQPCLAWRAIPSTAPPPAQRSTAWSRPPRSTARSPIRGCLRLRRLKIMKPCCRGTARQKCHGKSLTHCWVGGVYGSHTIDRLAGINLCVRCLGQRVLQLTKGSQKNQLRANYGLRPQNIAFDILTTNDHASTVRCQIGNLLMVADSHMV